MPERFLSTSKLGVVQNRPSKVCRRSSGNGASKSSGTVNSPAHKPNGRTVSSPVLTGFISTTGCPARTISSVSPASTFGFLASLTCGFMTSNIPENEAAVECWLGMLVIYDKEVYPC